MQTESKLKKHEFRVIYIIAKKNCTIFLGCAYGTCGRDFYVKELCLLRHELLKMRPEITGTHQRFRPAQCTAPSITITYHGEILTLVPQTWINHYCTID